MKKIMFVAFVALVLFTSGCIEFPINIYETNGDSDSGVVNINLPPDIDDSAPGEEGDCTVHIQMEPNPVCVGKKVTGSLLTDMPYGVCRIWYQPEGSEGEILEIDGQNYQVLNGDGEWSYTHIFMGTGNVDFRALCLKDSCWADSGRITLNVINCDEDSDSGSEGEPGPYQGMPCETVPGGEETCVQGACDVGICTYIPPYLVSPGRCECQ